MKLIKPHVVQTAPDLGANVVDMILATHDLIQKSVGEKRTFYERKFDEMCGLEYIRITEEGVA